MKVKYLILLIMLFISTGIATAEDNGAVSVTSPTVIIDGYEITPSVLMPGDTGTLTVTLKNTNQNSNILQNVGASSGGFATTKSTSIGLFVENVHLEGNGILVLSPDFSRLGSLGPGQSVPVTFLIQAPETDGIYFPEVWIDVRDGTSTRYPVPVNVNTHIAVVKKPELILNRTLPDQVVPGNEFTLFLDLSNTGSSRADDITVAINASASSLSLNGPGNYYLGHLDPGDHAAFNLSLSTDKDSPLGLRDIPVTITFANPDGTRVTQIEHVGVHMKGKAEVSIKSLTTDPVRVSPGPFTMILRIENTGTDDAKSVEASIDLPMAGNHDAFVGKIEPGNDAPAVFYLTDTTDGDFPYTVSVQYSDDYGNHTIRKQLTLSVSRQNNILIIAAVAALVGLCVAGIWYYRRKKGQ